MPIEKELNNLNAFHKTLEKNDKLNIKQAKKKIKIRVKQIKELKNTDAQYKM